MRAETRTERLLAPVTRAGCSGLKVNTRAAVLYKGLIPYIHKTPFIQRHFKALVHPAYTEQRVKLNSVIFAPSSGGKNNQALLQRLSPGCTRHTLCWPWPCATCGSRPSGIQVIRAPRDKVGTHTASCSHIGCICERTRRS